jgi:hypothetical protein
MSPDEFVAVVEKVVYATAVEGTVASLHAGPPGRGPAPRPIALHEWYGDLSANDQRMVAEVVRDAAYSAVFGFLCVLDGVVAIDDPPHAELRLTAIRADGRTDLLNHDPSFEDLHDKFNVLVHPPSEHWPND